MKFIDDLIEAVKQELGIPKPKDPKESICNLSIKLEGWQGTYSNGDTDRFLRIAKKMKKLRKFERDFTCLRDGTLYPMFTDGLQKYCGTIDLDDLSSVESCDSFEMRPFRNYNLPHIHLENNGILDIPYEAIDESAYPRVRSSPFSRPHYILKGLHSALPDKKMNHLIKALQEELFYRKGYIDNSISAKKETKLKLLENRYRREVSNQ